MFFDDNRDNANGKGISLDAWAQVVYKDKDAAKHVAGTAFHWYGNNDQNLDSLEKTHQMAPEKFILSTDTCQSYQGKNKLGFWSYAEAYARDIMKVSVELPTLFICQLKPGKFSEPLQSSTTSSNNLSWW